MLNHIGTQIIETSRLILRKYEMSDAEDMFKNWVTDPEVSRFWSWEPHKNIEETKSLLAGWVEEYEKLDRYCWVIILKSISQAVGYILFSVENESEGSLAVHYALSSKYWNQGIMSEACKGVFEFAFDEIKAQKIYSRHHVDNPASGRVMQKCGMRYVKTEYRSMPHCERISGDYCYYEITENEWRLKCF